MAPTLAQPCPLPACLHPMTQPLPPTMPICTPSLLCLFPTPSCGESCPICMHTCQLQVHHAHLFVHPPRSGHSPHPLLHPFMPRHHPPLLCALTCLHPLLTHSCCLHLSVCPTQPDTPNQGGHVLFFPPCPQPGINILIEADSDFSNWQYTVAQISVPMFACFPLKSIFPNTS